MDRIDMDQDDLMTLVGKTGALMEQFERRCADIEERQLAFAHDLQQLTQQISELIDQSARSALQVLPDQILDKVQSGLDRPVNAYEQRLQKASTQLGDAANLMTTQIQRMERLHRHMVWKTVGITIGCMLLLLVGGVWLASHYYGVIRDNQIAGDLLRAYNRADVTLCGKDQLCANVDAKGSRYGDHQQYRPVKPR